MKITSFTLESGVYQVSHTDDQPGMFCEGGVLNVIQ